MNLLKSNLKRPKDNTKESSEDKRGERLNTDRKWQIGFIVVGWIVIWTIVFKWGNTLVMSKMWMIQLLFVAPFLTLLNPKVSDVKVRFAFLFFNLWAIIVYATWEC